MYQINEKNVFSHFAEFAAFQQTWDLSIFCCFLKEKYETKLQLCLCLSTQKDTWASLKAYDEKQIARWPLYAHALILKVLVCYVYTSSFLYPLISWVYSFYLFLVFAFAFVFVFLFLFIFYILFLTFSIGLSSGDIENLHKF